MPPYRGKRNQLSNPFVHALYFILRILGREVQVGLSGKDQSLRLDALHSQLEITIVGLLC